MNIDPEEDEDRKVEDEDREEGGSEPTCDCMEKHGISQCGCNSQALGGGRGGG